MSARHSDPLLERATALVDDYGFRTRDLSRLVGVSPSTVTRWRREAPGSALRRRRVVERLEGVFAAVWILRRELEPDEVVLVLDRPTAVFSGRTPRHLILFEAEAAAPRLEAFAREVVGAVRRRRAA